MQLQVSKEISKNNKEYYGIFLVKGDYKILIKFISKNQYEELTKQK